MIKLWLEKHEISERFLISESCHHSLTMLNKFPIKIKKDICIQQRIVGINSQFL